MGSAIAPPSLQWSAAYQRGLLAEAREGPVHGLLKLDHWPDLSQLPDELVEPVARLCALLWRKPCASTLVARQTGLPPEQAGSLVRVLADAGHVEVLAGAPGTGNVVGAHPSERAGA